MSEVSCPQCLKTSRTFDPFMSLSVPIPEYSKVTLSVYVVRKMPHLPRYHRKTKEPLGGVPFPVLCEYLQLYNSTRGVFRYAVNVPRLATLPEVKSAIGTACGIDPTFLVLTESMNGSVMTVFDDEKHTALNLKPFTNACVVDSQEVSGRGEQAWQEQAVTGGRLDTLFCTSTWCWYTTGFGGDQGRGSACQPERGGVGFQESESVFFPC